MRMKNENGCPLSRETYSYCFGDGGFHNHYDQIPTEHVCSDEMFRYLEEHECPRPYPEDWYLIE